jgi:hypothetical protein
MQTPKTRYDEEEVIELVPEEVQEEMILAQQYQGELDMEDLEFPNFDEVMGG